jgi:trehalose/maltose hydrolase-like predicted phosphorylase
MGFWDADTWMFPAIAPTWPHLGRQFVEARLKQFPQALRNAQVPYVQEKYGFDNQSAIFPWTAGRFANATATGPVLDYEYHVNPGIALMCFNYLAITGDDHYFQEKLWPMVNAIGHTITTLLFRNGSGWSISNMTDPDEYAVCVLTFGCQPLLPFSNFRPYLCCIP